MNALVKMANRNRQAAFKKNAKELGRVRLHCMLESNADKQRLIAYAEDRGMTFGNAIMSALSDAEELERLRFPDVDRYRRY
jgi:hypothetical protein